jgi:N-acetylglutamate synthase-like GNAT family acetyltransferase
MDKLRIRPWEPADQATVLNLMDLNTPRWFAPAERKALEDYLAREREDYFVLELESQVVGCGGVNYFPGQKLARIAWDILHPAYQGKGYGSHLLRYRLDLIRANSAIERVIVRTSQVAYLYYAKNGFRLLETVGDYWAPGFDLYTMELRLEPQ